MHVGDPVASLQGCAEVGTGRAGLVVGDLEGALVELGAVNGILVEAVLFSLAELRRVIR